MYTQFCDIKVCLDSTTLEKGTLLRIEVSSNNVMLKHQNQLNFNEIVTFKFTIYPKTLMNFVKI